ncbi:histone acetyltransferase KAT2B-like isoform X2 [Dysidea avara]|uniref:histone acetyltransferase KAT2B-like isoform X2 n=1 Tax=Dysidea avara TaxID=196820 RepID=UPI003328CE1E
MRRRTKVSLSVLEAGLLNSSPIWREDFNQTPEAIASLKTPSPAAPVSSPATSSSVRVHDPNASGPGKQDFMTSSPMPSMLSPFTSVSSPAGTGPEPPQIFTQEFPSSDSPRYHPIARTASLGSSSLMTSFSPDQALLQDDSSKPSPKRPKIEGQDLMELASQIVATLTESTSMVGPEMGFFNERDQLPKEEEHTEVLKFQILHNNFKEKPPDQHLIMLKNVFSHQLPRMPIRSTSLGLCLTRNTNHSDQEYYIHCLVCFIARCTSSLEMDHRRRKGGRLGG